MSLIIKFWKNCLADGRKLRPIWALVSLGGEQPEGYISGWSISKRAAEQMLNQKLSAEHWRLVRIVP